METHYIKELETTAAEFLEELKQFSAAEITTIPFEGSWSAAQVGEHILKSAAGIPAVLQGNNKAAARNPEEKVAILREIFLDFEKKMKSPAFIVPSATPPSKKELLHRLSEVFSNIIQAGKKINVEREYIDFPFPEL